MTTTSEQPDGTPAPAAPPPPAGPPTGPGLTPPPRTPDTPRLGQGPDAGPGRRGHPTGGWGPVAGLLVAAAIAVDIPVARATSYTLSHRQVAAVAALLTVVAVGVGLHALLIGAQTPAPRSRTTVGQVATLRFRQRGLKAALVGSDGRVSTSRTQICLWTGTLVMAFVYLLLLARSLPGTLFTNSVTTGWRPEYLVLLGLPATAATVAQAAVSRSNGGIGPVAANTVAAGDRAYVRKPVAADHVGVLLGLTELFTDDDGTVAWPDLQYVLFTAIALVNFVAQLAGDPAVGLPPVPAALLTLMGVSAATYTTSKVLETTGTVVRSTDSGRIATALLPAPPASSLTDAFDPDLRLPSLYQTPSPKGAPS